VTRFSVIYYSNGSLPEALKWHCLQMLASAINGASGELICVTWEPLEFPEARNIVWAQHVSQHRNLYEQILAGISEAKTDLVALAEHDVLYPPGYHDELLGRAGTGACFNTNVWRLNSNGYFRDENSRLLSNYGGRRDVVRSRIEEKLSEVRRCGRVATAEPAGDPEIATPLPTVDIRHGMNWTGNREPADGVYLEMLEFWGSCREYTRWFTSDAVSESTKLPHTPAASPTR
jgi:hypothetical protein